MTESVKFETLKPVYFVNKLNEAIDNGDSEAVAYYRFRLMKQGINPDTDTIVDGDLDNVSVERQYPDFDEPARIRVNWKAREEGTFEFGF